jgi:hypothetical protein
LGDGVYRISGTPLRTGVAGSRYVGNCPAVTVVWNPTRHLSVLTQYVHFFAGPYFRANPPEKDTDYFTVWLDYKF